MLGALVKATNIIGIDDLITYTQKKLQKKFRGNTKVIQGNLKSIKKAYQEVKE
jgi:pyruvate ferredoxin oxidoreductase gamma subunit